LGEDALGQGIVGRRAGDRDFVAPHQDVAVQRRLDELEHLVARPKQVDHQPRIVDSDLGLDPGTALAGDRHRRRGARWRACRHGWAGWPGRLSPSIVETPWYPLRP